MKQIITAALLLSLSLQADPSLHEYELMRLPHPLQALVQNAEALKLSEAQRGELYAMMEQMPAKMHAMLDEAQTKERAIRRAVLHGGKSRTEMAEALDELALLKRRVTDSHIDALNRLQSMLNGEQYAALLRLVETHKNEQNTRENETYGTLK